DSDLGRDSGVADAGRSRGARERRRGASRGVAKGFRVQGSGFRVQGSGFSVLVRVLGSRSGSRFSFGLSVLVGVRGVRLQPDHADGPPQGGHYSVVESANALSATYRRPGARRGV